MQFSPLSTFLDLIWYAPWWYYVGIVLSILLGWWFWWVFKPSKPFHGNAISSKKMAPKLDLPADTQRFEKGLKDLVKLGPIDLHALKNLAPQIEEMKLVDIQEEVELLLKMSIGHDAPGWTMSEATLNLRRNAFQGLLESRHNPTFSVNRVLFDLTNGDYNSLIYLLFINEKIAIEGEPADALLAAEYAKQQACFLYTPTHIHYALESLQRALSYTSEDRYAAQHLSQFHRQLGNLPEAIKYQQYLALLCYGQHQKTPHDVVELHNMALCFEQLYDLYWEQNDLDKALEAQIDACRIRHELMERQTGNLLSLEKVWSSHLHLAMVLTHLKRDGEAIFHYRQGIHYAEKLASFSDNRDLMVLDLALNYRKLAILLHHTDEPKLALVEFQRSYDWYHKQYQLKQHNPEILSHYKLACSYLAEELLVLAEWQSALKYFLEMYSVCNTLIDLTHEVPENWFYGAHALYKMATIYWQLGELPSAFECTQKSILGYQKILQKEAIYPASLR
ncbi:MAG: hypothetical protein QM520_06590, partial [Gammaproteobacteria bacterium]|nr:hypothetical protein [Gammaproteobacteria bacterium]